MSERVWTSRDGSTTPVGEMPDSHLLNAIRWCERNEEAIRLREFARYFSGPGPNGDGAQMAYESAIDEFATADFEDAYEPYGWLIAEATKRGIS